MTSNTFTYSPEVWARIEELCSGYNVLDEIRGMAHFTLFNYASSSATNEQLKKIEAMAPLMAALLDAVPDERLYSRSDLVGEISKELIHIATSAPLVLESDDPQGRGHDPNKRDCAFYLLHCLERAGMPIANSRSGKAAQILIAAMDPVLAFAASELKAKTRPIRTDENAVYLVRLYLAARRET